MLLKQEKLVGKLPVLLHAAHVPYISLKMISKRFYLHSLFAISQIDVLHYYLLSARITCTQKRMSLCEYVVRKKAKETHKMAKNNADCCCCYCFCLGCCCCSAIDVAFKNCSFLLRTLAQTHTHLCESLVFSCLQFGEKSFILIYYFNRTMYVHINVCAISMFETNREPARCALFPHSDFDHSQFSSRCSALRKSRFSSICQCVY